MLTPELRRADPTWLPWPARVLGAALDLASPLIRAALAAAERICR